MWDTNDLEQVAATVAHELGHNLGLDHDSADCDCPGCLMSSTAFTNKSTQWSSCSRDYLRTAYSQGMDYCLRNVPQQVRREGSSLYFSIKLSLCPDIRRSGLW